MPDTEDPNDPELITALLNLLDVEPTGEDTFTGRRKPGGIGRVFGGQVIAQALVAAERTVAEDRPIHSLHAYFLRGGSEDHAIDMAVTRDLDGGSFSNRRVTASQQGRPILTLSASFQRHEEGLRHQDVVMPAVRGPEGLVTDHELRLKYAERAAPSHRHLFTQARPIEMRGAEDRHWTSEEPAPPRTHTWLRAVAPLPDDPHLHRAVLAHASDMALLGTCILPHGLSWSRGEVISASLDHAIWFHGSFRADEWLLYATHSSWSDNGRGINRGQVFTQDGRLVATVMQEGMIRKRVKKAS